MYKKVLLNAYTQQNRYGLYFELWKNGLESKLTSTDLHVKQVTEATLLWWYQAITIQNSFRQEREIGHLLYLAWQDVSKRRESVVQSLVIDGFVKVFDEDVSHAALSQWRITLWPHDAHRPPLDYVKVHGVQCTLGWKKKRRFGHLGVKWQKLSNGCLSALREFLGSNGLWNA